MTRGVYVAPSAVVEAPEYVKRLREEFGVDVFQLRTGFVPSSEVAVLDKAVELLRGLDAQIWLLVGTWWGHGVQAQDDRMEPLFEPPMRYTAHEAQFPMRTPGGSGDDEIANALRALLKSHSPDGICLTHARYHHAADISGMFAWGAPPFTASASGEGIDPQSLIQYWTIALSEVALRAPEELLAHAEQMRLPEFLDHMSSSDKFTNWFELRARLIERAVDRFRQVAKAYDPNVAFGVNAMNPAMAELTGQFYGRLRQICDFVQPLLGYVEWHMLQPLAAWAALLTGTNKKLREDTSIRIAANLLGIEAVELPNSVSECLHTGEGPSNLIFDLVYHQLGMVTSMRDSHGMLLPVLNGHGWPSRTLFALEEAAESSGFQRVFLQGTDMLTGEPPVAGWR